MTVETNPSLISDLNAAWPLDTDPRFEGAGHIREIKSVLQKQFPNADEALSGKTSKLNLIMGNFDDTGLFQPTGAISVSKGLTVTGAMQTGSQTITGASGANRQTVLATDGKGARFAYGIDGVAETGSNAGSNFYVSRFDDTGTYIDNPIYINRNSGNVTFGSSVFLTGAIDWSLNQAVTAKAVDGRYVAGTAAGSNVAVTNIQMVGAPSGDTASAYLQVGTGKYAVSIPTNGNVSNQIRTYAQPIGDYATNTTLTADVGNLQNQINGKQASGSYVNTPTATSGSSDLRVNSANFSPTVNAPYLSSYNTSGGLVSYILAQLSDLPLDRTKKLQDFQVVIQSGQRVNFPSGFSSSPDRINLTPTQRVDLWYTNQDSGGFTINSNVSGSQTISVSASGNK